MRRIIQLYEKHNVLLDGVRGSGKDMLTGNVIVRRNRPYISNCNYGGDWISLDFKALDCRNNYRNFLSGNLNHYEWPYDQYGTIDTYVSDAGIILPAQYQAQLCKDYPNLPTTQALYRQLSDTGDSVLEGHFHCNSQLCLRIWDKVREQSDVFLHACWCIPFAKPLRVLNSKIKKKYPNFKLFDTILKIPLFNLVVQKVILYERCESMAARVPPFPLKRPLFNPDRKQLYDIQAANYLIAHGKVKPMILIYFNRSSYNTVLFKEMLQNA